MALTFAAVAASAKVADGHRQAKGPWSHAVQLAKPTDADLLPPTVAISPTGNVAIGYGATDENEPQNADAELAAGTGGTLPTGKTNTGKAHAAKAHDRGVLGTRFGNPEQIPTAQRVLAVGTLGGQLELLTGDGDGGSLTGDTAPDGARCCMEMDAQTRVGAGFYSADQPLVSGLDGGSAATLIPEKSGALAVLAAGNGIWTAYGSNAKASFGATHLFAPFSGQPPVVAAGTLSGDRALIVWTQPRTALYVPLKGQSVYYAVAPAGRRPGAQRVAFKVKAGYSVSQVAVARHGGVASIAWVESWIDILGHYHSRVYAADLKGRRAVDTRVVSPVNRVATQIAFAGGGTKPEVLTWQGCVPGGTTCTAQAALRPRGGNWGPVATLGKVGAGSAPVAGMTTTGTALVGWVEGGHIEVADAAAGTTGFSKPQRLDRSGSAAKLTLATGPGGTAAAAWTDGLVAQSLHAAFYEPPLS